MMSSAIMKPSLDAGEGVLVPGPGGAEALKARGRPRAVSAAAAACLR